MTIAETLINSYKTVKMKLDDFAFVDLHCFSCTGLTGTPSFPLPSTDKSLILITYLMLRIG